MSLFIILFYGGYPEEQSEQYIQIKWKQWIESLQKDNTLIAGGPFNPYGITLAGKERKEESVIVDNSSPSSFLLIRAGTMEEAVAIAEYSPSLELDGGLDIFEIGNLEIPAGFSPLNVDSIYIPEAPSEVSENGSE